MPYKDKEKQRLYQQNWEKTHTRPKTSRIKRNEMVREAKDKPCIVCKVKYHYSAMDLHHRNPEEKDGMINTICKNGSYQALREEIDKCVVMCSNCHRLLHAGQIELPGRVT